MRAFAALVGTSNQQINKLELGHRQLTIDWLLRLAAALGCHPWEVVEEGPRQLSNREQQLLQSFRRLSDEQQESLLTETTARARPSGVGKRRAG